MNRLVGAVHIALAVAVGLYHMLDYVLLPLFGAEGASVVWEVLYYGMALGGVLSVYYTYTWMRGLGDDASGKDWITHRALFVGAAILVLWYFPDWIADAVSSHTVNALFALVAGCVGCRLWSQG